MGTCKGLRCGIYCKGRCVWRTLQGKHVGAQCLYHMGHVNEPEFLAVCKRITAIPGRSKEELLESYQTWRDLLQKCEMKLDKPADGSDQPGDGADDSNPSQKLPEAAAPSHALLPRRASGQQWLAKGTHLGYRRPPGAIAAIPGRSAEPVAK